MNISFPVFTRINEVLFKKKNLSAALIKAKENTLISPRDEQEIKKEAYVFLRHFFSLRFECSDLLSQYDYESDEFILSMVALSQLRYSSMRKEEISAEYQDVFCRLKLSGDSQKNRKVLIDSTIHPFHIPEEVKSSPYYYNSLVLERPEFLFRRFDAEFGASRTLAMFSSRRKKPLFYYSARGENSLPSSLKKEKDVGPYPLFSSSSPLHQDVAAEKKLYPCSPLQLTAYSLPELPQVSPKVLRNGRNDSFSFLPLAISRKDDYQPTRIVNCYGHAFASAKKNVEIFDLQNVTILNCESKLLKTYYPYDSFDLSVEIGKDVGLGCVGMKPWLLPSLTPDDLKDSQKRQLLSLRERAEFVKSKGCLLFVNHGLLKEETSDIVKQFVGRNGRFELVKETISIPDGSNQEGGYIALLSKK